MAEKKKVWIPDYTIKDARIMWRNFQGRAEKYNGVGERNFTVFLTPEDSEALLRMGLNVKTLPVKEEGQVPQDILKVKVNFNPQARPPRLVLVTHRGRTQLTQDEAPLLDVSSIKKVDLILSPYPWEFDGKEGVGVSLKAIYMTINEDELEVEYGDLPEATGALRGREYTPDFGEDDEPSAPRPSFR